VSCGWAGLVLLMTREVFRRSLPSSRWWQVPIARQQGGIGPQQLSTTIRSATYIGYAATHGRCRGQSRFETRMLIRHALVK
jgi:hypothetical protein